MTLDFIIIGAQKAATSSLQSGLRRVPGVYMPAGESPFFEDPDFADGKWISFGQPDAVCGIKRPDNLARREVADRVADAVPNAKLIVVFREPIGRAVSAYYHLVRHAHLPVKPLSDGLRDALDSYDRGEESPLSSVIGYGMYGASIARWLDRMPSENFLFLTQRAVTANLDDTLEECCALIGVRFARSWRPTDRSENIGIYDSRYLGLYRFGHRLKTVRLGGTDRRGPRRNLILRGAGSAVTHVATRLADPGAKPPALDEHVRSRMRAIYHADRQILRSLVPPDAIDWSYDDGDTK
ncbi:sulfotransferase domain-containing protein [Microbacterium sp. HD4P20]|uniref:sulfotransferase domain-containing protein n=1 Tax=Microbacterium sp. HD4P20 TaxID=2864874 RepID=UPI001C64395E|nr:sulfotransferase domain-containing protein [Microbacterium sp. HD4P20]MCP2638111.1 sulfotransferase domain-containing protein [Microbacterium sp. HD4P20]